MNHFDCKPFGADLFISFDEHWGHFIW